MKKKTTILFISQGTIGKELSKIALKVSSYLKEENINIIYKLHPGEYSKWKSNYPWLLDSDIEIIDHNQKDMHHYFAQSNIQIGVGSTALFEGLGYGLKTIIVKLSGHKYVEELYKNSLADIAEDAKEVCNIIKLAYKDKKYLPNIEYYWESNSLKKMNVEINNIISEYQEV